MSGGGELVFMFGALHAVALGLGAVLLVMFLRSDEPPEDSDPPEDEDPGGGNDRTPDRPPTRSPSGGVPLPTAAPARVRLRGHERLADAHRPRERRPAREPAPRHVPARH